MPHKLPKENGEGEKKMSMEFTEEENKIKQADIDNKTVVFWSKALKHRIGNWRPEKKTAGHIDQPEQSLYFEQHVFTTDDPEKIEFIRKSHGFINGDVIECPEGIEEARKFTMQLNIRKEIKEYKAEDVSKTFIEMKE